MIESNNVDLGLVLAFVSGVSIIFISFGYVLNYINENLLSSQKNINRIFRTLGVVSVVLGTNMLIG